MKIILTTLTFLFLSQAYAFDLSHKFGLGVSGGFPIPVFNNSFNDVNNAKWNASLYGRYHFTESFGMDLGLSHDAFKGSSVKFNNANLLGFWRMAGSHDMTPIVGLGLGFTRIMNFDPKSIKLSLLGRLGLEYGFSQCLSIAVLADYQYVSKVLGNMPSSTAHIINPQLALTWYYGAEKAPPKNEQPMATPPKKVSKNEIKNSTKEVDEDIVSIAEAATLRAEHIVVDEKPDMTIEFDSNQAKIKSEFIEKLQIVAKYLNANLEASGSIEGYADSSGSKKSNLLLSRKRANAVKIKLVGMGVLETRLSSQGFGEDDPIADNSTVEGRQKNRRVNVVISIMPNLSDRM